MIRMWSVEFGIVRSNKLMNWLRKIQTRLRALFAKRRLDMEMDEEMRSHIEMQTRENIEAGMAPEEARYTALRQFGHVDGIKETCRDQREGFVTRHLSLLTQDLRFAVRTFRKNPGFAAAMVLTLALGIGLNTAVFSIVNDLLLQPLPGIRNPAELFAVCYRNKDGRQINPNISFPFYEMYREECRSFSDLIGYAPIYPKIIEEGRSKAIRTELVSEDYFSVLGVAPALGRTFSTREDENPERDSVAVISHAFWVQRFGEDTNVIGRTLTLNNQSLMIIGVAPKGFHGLSSFGGPEVWMPRSLEQAMNEHTVYRMVGRLAPGVTRQQAVSELELIGERIEAKYGRSAPPGYERYGLFRTENRRPALYHAALGTWGPDRQGRDLATRLSALFMGAVGLVLLIACGNAANLLFVRALRRRKEIAIRLSLGAGRGRIIRQLTVESVLLALLGSGLGILLAHWGDALLLTFRTGVLKYMTIEPDLDGRVLTFTVGLALLTGIIFGLVPAWQAVKFDLHPTLKEETPRLAVFGRFAPRNFLVVAQVAVCLTLLLGAGLCLRSFAKLTAIDPGFDSENVFVASVSLGEEKGKPETAPAFIRQLTERVRALPGVESVTISDMIPLMGSASMSINELEGYEKQGDESISFGNSYVGPGYFRTLGIPVLQGREFDARDRRGSLPVAIVNRSFVRRYWPEQNPLGKRIMGKEVVGVVRDSRVEELWIEPAPHVYFSKLQSDLRYFRLLVKAGMNPERLTPQLRNELKTLDKSASLSRATTLDRVVSESLGGQRLLMVLLGVFAVLAMIFSSVGLYGVIAYSVAQRVREIGIRMALGARRQDVVKLVIAQGTMLISVGTIIGVAIALAATRLLRSYLYEVPPTDLLTFACVPLLLAGVCLLACWMPARRAAKVDPIKALRYE